MTRAETKALIEDYFNCATNEGTIEDNLNAYLNGPNRTIKFDDDINNTLAKSTPCRLCDSIDTITKQDIIQCISCGHMEDNN